VLADGGVAGALPDGRFLSRKPIAVMPGAPAVQRGGGLAGAPDFALSDRGNREGYTPPCPILDFESLCFEEAQRRGAGKNESATSTGPCTAA
jgi:hypothetical protein